MTTEQNRFKSLNFPKAQLFSSISTFCSENNLSYKIASETDKNQMLKITGLGIKDASFTIYHNTDGTTSFSHKLGQNQQLSLSLAEYLLTMVTIEQGKVSVVLNGYSIDDICPIIDLMTDKKHPNGDSFFAYERKDVPGGVQFVIENKYFKDKLYISVFKSRKLFIQGLPLSCYDEFVFQMSALLDANGLAQVISKTDDSCIQSIEPRVIENNLQHTFEETYEKIPPIIKNMLISGSSLRAIKVSLPDYSCMVYPDLRALEGVLKNIFFNEDVEFERVGFLFKEDSVGKYILKSESAQIINNRSLSLALGEAYSFYYIHRHTLFHMEDDVRASRVITNFQTVLDLSEDVYKLIKSIYKASK